MQKSKKSSIQKNRNSLANVAYEKIKRMIITLHYKPGEYLNESEICKEFNFTRTPVHLAIHRLASDRLIQIIPQKGIIVQPLSIDEMKNILEVRKLIEPYCCMRAAENATPEEIDQMFALLDLAPKMIENRDIPGLVDLDHQFHQMIANASKNPVLAEMLSGLYSRIIRYWAATWTNSKRLQIVYNEHSNILKKIKSHNAKVAALAMEKHIDSIMKASLGSDS
ncbi:MAG: GntR family transcriptional regulator [Ignavibacteriaceae bacterium]|jgi:DNA-binding GntR family transcriptional regulator